MGSRLFNKSYHCPGTRWYGKTKEGKYMTQKEAQGKGWGRSYIALARSWKRRNHRDDGSPESIPFRTIIRLFCGEM